MQTKADRLDVIKKMIWQQEAAPFTDIERSVICSSVTLQRSLKMIGVCSSKVIVCFVIKKVKKRD